MTRVLIVDDDQDIRETTADLLRLRSFEVQAVARVADVEPAVRAFKPDVLLQDCHMPGLDLASLLKTVRSGLGRELAILLFTASTEAEGFWRPLGADGVVRKPYDVAVLEAAIRRILARPATIR